MKKIIFFGPPGAGKGTQAKIISKYLNISHLSTGDILRKKLLDNDELAKQLQSIMSSGNLVSDDILNSIVSSRLKNETEKGFKELLSLFEQDPNWNDEAAKKKLLEFFDLLGFNDLNVVEARKKLASMMFK